MGKIVGIDLGTSNSAVAGPVGGKPTIIQAAEGNISGRQGLPVICCVYKGRSVISW